MPNNQENVEAKELKGKSKSKLDKKEKFNNQVVRVFDGVLDDDEKIVKTYKPSKLGVYLMNILKPLMLYLFFVIVFLFLYFMPSDELTKSDALLFLYFISGLTFLVEVGMFFISKRYLKNTYYVITNKRALLGSGFINFDIKSIELDNIQDVVLKWNFFDRLNLKKSGQIYFYGDDKSKNILFFATEKPLETYIEIQSFLEKEK